MVVRSFELVRLELAQFSFFFFHVHYFWINTEFGTLPNVGRKEKWPNSIFNCKNECNRSQKFRAFNWDSFKETGHASHWMHSIRLIWSTINGWRLCVFDYVYSSKIFWIPLNFSLLWIFLFPDYFFKNTLSQLIRHIPLFVQFYLFNYIYQK